MWVARSCSVGSTALTSAWSMAWYTPQLSPRITAPTTTMVKELVKASTAQATATPVAEKRMKGLRTPSLSENQPDHRAVATTQPANTAVRISTPSSGSWKPMRSRR